MRFEFDPLLLFGLCAGLSAIVAVPLWRGRRGVARAAAALAAVSGLCVLLEMQARRSGANIRIDLLVTIPAVSLGALLIGLIAVRRPPRAAQLAAIGLTLIGGAAAGWFFWMSARTTKEGARLTRVFEQSRRLYWEETIRCDANFARRFGRAGGECRGNLAVVSRSGSEYPYTRIAANGEDRVYLLYTPEAGVEENVLLDDRSVPLGRDDNSSGQRIRVDLRPTAPGSCEATVDRAGRVTTLTLSAAALPACEVPPAPPVRFLGAWGAAAPMENNYRRLVQMWLWEADGSARGLFLSAIQPRGYQSQFNFARRMRGARAPDGQWSLEIAGGGKGEERLTFARSGEKARVSGPATLFGPGGEMLLEPREITSHPKISLTPIYDAARFQSYFDNVFENLNVPFRE